MNKSGRASSASALWLVELKVAQTSKVKPRGASAANALTSRCEPSVTPVEAGKSDKPCTPRPATHAVSAFAPPGEVEPLRVRPPKYSPLPVFGNTPFKQSARANVHSPSGSAPLHLPRACCLPPTEVGVIVGALVGARVRVGARTGELEGARVGWPVGARVGESVGVRLGGSVGARVGELVGAMVRELLVTFANRLRRCTSASVTEEHAKAKASPMQRKLFRIMLLVLLRFYFVKVSERRDLVIFLSLNDPPLLS